MKIIRKEKGGTYEGRPKASKTKAISCRIESDLREKLLAECDAHQCTISTLLYSILHDRYNK